MRCQLKTAFSAADMDTANTESCVLGEETSVIKKPISSEKLKMAGNPSGYISIVSQTFSLIKFQYAQR